MFNYCKNLDGLLGMFSLVIQKELERAGLPKEEHSAATLHLIEKNAAEFRRLYCSNYCKKRNHCALAPCQKRAAL